MTDIYEYYLNALCVIEPDVRLAGGYKWWSTPASSNSNFLLTGPKQLGLIGLRLRLKKN